MKQAEEKQDFSSAGSQLKFIFPTSRLLIKWRSMPLLNIYTDKFLPVSTLIFKRKLFQVLMKTTFFLTKGGRNELVKTFLFSLHLRLFPAPRITKK